MLLVKGTAHYIFIFNLHSPYTIYINVEISPVWTHMLRLCFTGCNGSIKFYALFTRQKNAMISVNANRTRNKCRNTKSMKEIVHFSRSVRWPFRLTKLKSLYTCKGACLWLVSSCNGDTSYNKNAYD